MAVRVAERRTQAERTARSDKLILQAAMRLVAEKGYSKTTLAEIGQEAGYTGGLVSHRFGSKDGLLFALVRRIAERFRADQLTPATEGRRGLDALRAAIDAYIHELIARGERIRALYVLMAEALGPVPALRPFFVDLNREFRTGIEAMLRDGVTSGEIRADLDTGAAAASIVATLRGLSMQWLTDPDAFDLEAVRKHVVESLARQLQS